MNIYTTLIEKLCPHQLKQLDPVDQSDYILLINMITIVTIVSAIYLLYAIKQQLSYLAIILAITITSYLFSLFLIKYKNSKKLAARLFLSNLLVNFLSAYIAGNGGSAPAITWIIIFPIIAISATSIKEGKIWAWISTILALGISLYIHTNHIDLHLYTSEKLFAAATINLIFGPIVALSIISFAYRGRQSLTNSLNKKAQQLEQLNQENKRLISIIIHDLANPLSVIQLNAAHLNKKCIESCNILKQVSQIAHSATIINELLTSVREMKAIQEGKKKLEKKQYPLNLLEERILLVFTELLTKKQLTLNINYNNLETKQIYTNISALSNNILHNLISNAIKFSYPESSIDIEFLLENENLKITICNHGPQIPPDKIETLFQYSVVTTTTGTQGETGTGFGLPIAYQTIQELGGSISVDSSKEHTCFTVILQTELT